jgi:hypothetical protein
MNRLYDAFSDIYKKYYMNGNYLVDVPSTYNLGKEYTQKYVSYMDEYVLERIVTIQLFQIDVAVALHRPYGEVHRYEYENHFNFGAHCKNFNPQKTVIFCPKLPIISLDELKTKFENYSDDISEKTIYDICILMILGGYSNSMVGINEILEICENELNHKGITKEKMLEVMFNTIANV